MNYIYTVNGASPTDAANDALMFGEDQILRLEATTATTTTAFIMSHVGDLDADKIVLTHASLKNKEVMNAFVKMAQMQNKDGFVLMSGFDTLTPEFFPINNLDSTILVTDIVGTQG